jgi:hypothetical protein
MTPPPCLNNVCERSIENFTPYSNWVVDKEVITKDIFGLGWMPSEVCVIFDVKTHNAWTKRLA